MFVVYSIIILLLVLALGMEWLLITIRRRYRERSVAAQAPEKEECSQDFTANAFTTDTLEKNKHKYDETVPVFVKAYDTSLSLTDQTPKNTGVSSNKL